MIKKCKPHGWTVETLKEYFETKISSIETLHQKDVQAFNDYKVVTQRALDLKAKSTEWIAATIISLIAILISALTLVTLTWKH